MMHALFYFCLLAINFQPNVDEFESVLQYREDAVHYRYPIAFTYENQTGTTKTYKLPIGTILNTSNKNMARFILAEDLIITIANKKKKTLWIKAFALDTDKKMPESSFVIKPNGVETKLVPLLQFMAEKEWSFIECQQAIWVAANNQPLTEIYGFRNDVVVALQNFLAKERGVSPPEPPSKDDHLRNYEAPNEQRYQIFISGKLRLRLNAKSNIEMSLFNSQNKIVRELITPKERVAGMHVLRYAFDASLYQDSLFTIKVLANNEILIQKPLDVR